jgi:hypothetical protein
MVNFKVLSWYQIVGVRTSIRRSLNYQPFLPADTLFQLLYETQSLAMPVISLLKSNGFSQDMDATKLLNACGQYSC